MAYGHPLQPACPLPVRPSLSYPPSGFWCSVLIRPLGHDLFSPEDYFLLVEESEELWLSAKILNYLYPLCPLNPSPPKQAVERFFGPHPPLLGLPSTKFLQMCILTYQKRGVPTRVRTVAFKSNTVKRAEKVWGVSLTCPVQGCPTDCLSSGLAFKASHKQSPQNVAK